MTSIYEVLDHLRASALSEADKGGKFEPLVLVVDDRPALAIRDDQNPS